MNKRKWCVYKHTTPNNKIYIGITQQNPNDRWMNGIGYKAKNRHFWNAIKKYSWDNIKHEILYNGLDEFQAKLMEISLIRKYKSNQRDFGYNKSEGGEGYSGVKRTEEAKEKDRQLALKRWADPEYRNKCIKGQTKYRQENKGKIRHSPMSEEQKSLLSQYFKGRPNLKNRGENNYMYGKTPANARAVLQYDLDGNFIAEYKSLKEAFDATGCHQANIYKVIHGQRKSCKNYVWKYKEPI